MERWTFGEFRMPNYGPCVIEDFVPVTPTRALVSAGRTFRDLNFILEVSYRLGARLEISEPSVLREGHYLRLGHRHGETLVYTDGWQGPHQAFHHRGSIYYSDDAPTARLYRDGAVLIDHWPGVSEVGNPWCDGGDLYFEARDADVASPDGWHVYRADLDGRNVRRLVRGANPCVYDGFIYFGVWNGRAFDIARADRRHLLSANAHLPAGSAGADRATG